MYLDLAIVFPSFPQFWLWLVAVKMASIGIKSNVLCESDSGRFLDQPRPLIP
jgi:hypothetical protein